MKAAGRRDPSHLDRRVVARRAPRHPDVGGGLGRRPLSDPEDARPGARAPARRRARASRPPRPARRLAASLPRAGPALLPPRDLPGAGAGPGVPAGVRAAGRGGPGDRRRPGLAPAARRPLPDPARPPAVGRRRGVHHRLRKLLLRPPRRRPGRRGLQEPLRARRPGRAARRDDAARGPGVPGRRLRLAVARPRRDPRARRRRLRAALAGAGQHPRPRRHLDAARRPRVLERLPVRRFAAADAAGAEAAARAGGVDARRPRRGAQRPAFAAGRDVRRRGRSDGLSRRPALAPLGAGLPAAAGVPPAAVLGRAADRVPACWSPRSR